MKPNLHPVVLSLLLAFTAVSARAAEADVTGTNQIHGIVGFSNVDPDIRARLGPPGDEGMGSFVVFAYTEGPDTLQTTKFIVAADKLSEPYDLTVSADDTARTFSLYAYLALDADSEEYWTTTKSSAPITRNPPAVEVNLDDCVALLEIRYQRADGTPVAAEGGRVTVYETGPPYGMRARSLRQPPGREVNHLVVPSGVELRVEVEVDTGSDIYLDRQTHRETMVGTFACDEKPTLVVTIPDAGGLGNITGQFNLVGELELPTEGYLELLGRPVVKAAGPLGNQRYAAVAADWPGPDAARTFTLENLAPSTDTELWSLAAEMHFGEGYRFEYFRTPGLGEGTNNPGVVVTAGAAADLGGAFEMLPAKLTGRITLVGPPEIDGRQSGLRGIVRASDYDADQNGIPDSIGAVGISGSYVVAAGVDELAAGATHSAAGGLGIASYAGGFNPDSAAIEGDYILALGSLYNQTAIWRQDGLNLALEHPGTNGAPFVSQSVYVQEDQPWQGELAAGGDATRDLRYGFAEVCLRIRSVTPFFYPRVVGSSGFLNGLDWEKNSRAYHVTLTGASAPPYTREAATNEAIVTMYLPEGTYKLSPALSVPDAEGEVSEVQLAPIDLTVKAQERLCIEDSLRIVITGPTCATNFGFLTFAEVFSKEATLTNLSLTTRPQDYPGIRLGYSDIRILEPVGVARTSLRTGHGLFFYFDGYTDHPEYYSNMVITAVARDNQGRVATREILAHFDFAPPTLNCPSDITVDTSNPSGAVVEFEVSATDDSPSPVWKVVCDPPSGSLFPIGSTLVQCTAVDACYNTNQCSFLVTVRPPTTECVLQVAASSASPPMLTLTWDCGGILQGASDLNGPWIDISDAASPYQLPADGPLQFFRVCVSGECSGNVVGSCSPPGLLAYEPFDYDTGSPLSGLNGGSGFSGAWAATIAGDSYTIGSGSLGFAPLCSSGARMTGTPGHTQMVRTLGSGFGEPGTVRYFSFLLRPEGVLNGGDLGGFHGLALAGGPGGDSLFVGKPGGADGGVLAPYVLEQVGGAGQVLSEVAPAIDETALLVVKAEFADGVDTFTLYVNPLPGAPELPAGVQKTDLDVGLGSGLMIYSGGGFSIDEIRVGETFESVSPFR